MAAAAREVLKRIEPSKAGPLLRLVGGLDVRGKGTNHPCLAVDPVVLCDVGKLTGKGLPPFGKHPHYGLIAVTTVVKGSFMDADNLSGVSEELNEAYDVYAVSAGKGLCHEEKTATEGEHIAVQTIFQIPRDKLNLAPEVTKVKKDDIPVLKLDGGEIRINIGALQDKESPAKLQSLPRIVMLRTIVYGGKILSVPLDTDLEHGYILVLTGRCRVGQEEIGEGEGILIFGEGANLEVENLADSDADMLIVAGKKLEEPWVKLLCRNGFLIAPDQETAESVEKVILQHEDDFSYKHVQI